MKIKEIQEKSTEELRRVLANVREDLREMKFRVSQNQHKDVRDIRELKKTIARILTILKKREQEKPTKTK